MTITAPKTDSIRQSPLDAVLNRLKDCSGFPTLSSTISDINRSVASDSDSTQQLTKVILRDASLTTKLLQVVNSAVYGQYRGRIRTVSKAVLILGFDTVRNLAMELMMLQFSKGRPQEKALQDELIGAFFAGAVARPLAQRLGLSNKEEAVICTMFHSLGRLLVIFFLYDESRKIRALMEAGVAEQQAAQEVLGISYRELGDGIARHWNFPDRLLEGMQCLPATDICAPRTEVEKVRAAASLANELYATVLRSSDTDKSAALNALGKRYGVLKLDAKELTAAIDQALKEIQERATTLNLPVAHSPTLSVIRVWTGGGADQQDEQGNLGETAEDALLMDTRELQALENPHDTAGNAQRILSAGIRDVTETLTSDFALNDLLQMVLETMYRGMGFTRTMIFIRDAKLNAMRARSGFGADIERVIPKCSFSLEFAPDVFHVAIDKGADISIENTQATNIVGRIPEWHRQAMDARSFLLLPVMLKNRALGLLYADSARTESAKISPEQLSLLRTLRSQVVLAFKHSVPQS